jgi:hypothetical protein
VERRSDDDHAHPAHRARGRVDGSGAVQARAARRQRCQDADLAAARAEIARLEETVKEQAIELVALRGKTRSGW